MEDDVTCNDAYLQSQSSLSLNDCKNEAKNSGFRFIYFQDLETRPEGEWCQIYSSCYETKSELSGGTTYEYIGNIKYL